MEENIKSQLEKDEKLLWTARPEPFSNLDKTHKGLFIRSIIISVLAAVLINGLYIIAVRSNDAEIKPVLIIAILIFSFLGPVSSMLYSAKLRKKVVYAATDERLIVYTGEMKSAPYPTIKEAAFRQDEDGHTTLLCGKTALESKPAKWRIATLFTLIDAEAKDGPLCDRFAFYAVPEPEKLKAVISPYVTFNA